MNEQFSALSLTFQNSTNSENISCAQKVKLYHHHPENALQQICMLNRLRVVGWDGS